MKRMFFVAAGMACVLAASGTAQDFCTVPDGGALAPVDFASGGTGQPRAQGGGRTGRPQRVTVSGCIKIYGNAPFTSVGFVTDDGREYTLQDGRGGSAGGPHDRPPQRKPPAGRPPRGNGAPPQGAPGAGHPAGEGGRKRTVLEELRALTGRHLELDGFVMASPGEGGGMQPPPPDGNAEPDAPSVQALKDGTFVVLDYRKK